MKRISVFLAIVICLAFAVSCADKNRGGAGEAGGIVTESSAESSVVPETSESSATPTPTQTPTPTPTPTPAPEIKVTSVVDETVSGNGYDFKNRIPEVSISGVDMSAFNKSIKKELTKWAKYHYYPESDELFGSVVDYEYYIGDGYISLICTSTQLDYEETRYKVYNISTETGKTLSSADLLKMLGLSESDFLSKAKDAYERWRNVYDIVSSSDHKKNLKQLKMEKLTPFVSSEGHLSYVGYFYLSGGAGEAYYRFDTEADN